MLSYSHMTIWANQSWMALGLDLDGLWSWKFVMVFVMKPLDKYDGMSMMGLTSGVIGIMTNILYSSFLQSKVLEKVKSELDAFDSLILQT